MANYIVKIQDRYLLWSTVVDAPTSAAMKLSDFTTFYTSEYGTKAHQEFVVRMQHVQTHGNSSLLPRLSNNELLANNKAGNGDTHLTEQEIYDQYKV
jgi:hypothetical protein